MATRGLHLDLPPLRSSPSFAVLDRAATGRTVPELARFFDAHLPYVMGFLNVSPAAPDPAPKAFVLPWLSFDAPADVTATTPKPAHASMPAVDAMSDAIPTPVVAPAAVSEVDEAMLVRAVASDPILRSVPSPLVDCKVDVCTDLVDKMAVAVAVDRIELGPGHDEASVEPVGPLTNSALVAAIPNSGGSGPSLDGTTIDGISASIVSTPRESPALPPTAAAHVNEDAEESSAVEVKDDTDASIVDSQESAVRVPPPPPPPPPPLHFTTPVPASTLNSVEPPRPRLVRRRTGLPPRPTSPKRSLPATTAAPIKPSVPHPPARPQTVPYPSSPCTAAIPAPPPPPPPPPPAPPSIISDAAAPDPLALFPRLAMWADSLRALHGSDDGDDDDGRMSTDTASTSLAASPVPTPSISPRGSLATMRTSSGTWSTASISSSRSAPAWAARPSLPPDMEHIHGMVALRLQRLPSAARRSSTAPATGGGMRQSVRHLWAALHERRSSDHYGSSISGSAPAWLRAKSAHSGVALALAEEALWKRLGTIVDRGTAQIVLADHFNHLCEQLVIDVTTCRPPARALRKLGKVAAALMDTRAYFSLVAVAAALWTLTTATPHANEPEWHLAAADRLAMHAVLHVASPAGRFAALRNMMLCDAATYTAVPLADRARVEASRRVCEWLWAM
ncbi:hypothetical protein GGF31_007742 [Allomyces arbusculus]|nr:hypothetical protein GGF31_007742 [Allomyces arbusculus]